MSENNDTPQAVDVQANHMNFAAKDGVCLEARSFIRKFFNERPCDITVFKWKCMDILNNYIDVRNAQFGGKFDMWGKYDSLPPMLAAEGAMLFNTIVHIDHESSESSRRGDEASSDPLAIYIADETNAAYGTYVHGKKTIEHKLLDFNGTLSGKGMGLALSWVDKDAPTVTLESDPDLIAMADGVYDYAEKKRRMFCPELVFTSKTATPMPPEEDLEEPKVILADGTEWLFTEWLESIQPDPETRLVIWDVIGALLRPYVSWGKVVFFTGEGRNGKSTLLALMRNLVGPKHCAAIPLADHDKKENLAPFLSAQANICDENDGAFIPSTQLIKALATGDTLTLRRLREDPITFTPHMVHIHAMNELPSFKDKSEGIYRRLLIVPFKVQIPEDEINPEIQDVCMKDPAVLEWVAWYALTKHRGGSYYKLGSSDETDAAKTDFKVETDPVAAFFNEQINNCDSAFLPFDFLYDWFCGWYGRTHNKKATLAQPAFTKNMLRCVAGSDRWADSKLLGKERPSVDVWMYASDAAARVFASDHIQILTRWFDGQWHNLPKGRPDQRGLMRRSVFEHCTANKINPRDFIDAHAGDGIQSCDRQHNADMLAQFVAECEAHTVSDASVYYPHGYKLTDGKPGCVERDATPPAVASVSPADVGVPL